VAARAADGLRPPRSLAADVGDIKATAAAARRDYPVTPYNVTGRRGSDVTNNDPVTDSSRATRSR